MKRRSLQKKKSANACNVMYFSAMSQPLYFAPINKESNLLFFFKVFWCINKNINEKTNVAVFAEGV